MVRPFNRNATSLEGRLVVERVHPNCVEVFFVPPAEKLTQSGLDPARADSYRVKLLLVSGQDNFVTLYPTNTLGGSEGFLKPKYDQVEAITLVGFGFSTPDDPDDVMDLLEELPAGFVKDYDFGLGLLKDYRFIIDAVEELSECTEIVIGKDVFTGIDKDASTMFSISYMDFESARKSVNRIAERARTAASAVKGNVVYNLVATLIGEKEKPLKIGKNSVSTLVARAAEDDNLEEADQQAVISVLSRNTKAIAETGPEILTKLRNNIELVTLEVFIERYDTMLCQNLKEKRWQEFFSQNPFILSLGFGYPLIKVQDQASVGGRKISGSGEKITDFLVKNSLTNNTALFEIKTPQTKLLDKAPYREGVFAPSRELSGSINQALDQKYQFQKQVAQIKETSRIYDIESYAVHSFLIIGKTPTEVDQQKSFELFRRNSKDVQVVTFDELLEKLRQLRNFLAEGDE